jgi:cleavage stimulation factor subunit 3
MYGDLAAVHKLESRFAETFPNGKRTSNMYIQANDRSDSPLKRFAQRFTYNGIDQIALRDLGFGIGPRSIAASARPTPIQAPLPPPHPSLPPLPPSLPQPPIHASPNNKRPLPGTSSPDQRRPSIDHSAQRPRSPEYKRQRPASPPRRFDGRPRYSRDRSPLPPQQLPQQGQGQGQPPMGMNMNMGMGMVVPPPIVPSPRDQLDPSGLTRPLVWFIGNLPSVRAFDGLSFFS